MAIKVNLEESLRGLLVGRGEGSYLSQFFPRLAQKEWNAIPIRGGFNVLYGRNGAGKSQILGALAAASQWEMGPIEGFLVEDPTWEVRVAGKKSSNLLSYLTTQEILEAISNEESEAVDLSWIWGFDSRSAKGDRLNDALEIIEEFRAAKTMLVTRGLRRDSIAGEGSQAVRAHLLPPAATELVPILLPNSEAPCSRAHMAQMRDSLLSILTASMESIGFNRSMSDVGIGGWEFEDESGRSQWDYMNGEVEEKICDALTSGFDLFRHVWAWSPLLNVRNVGRLTRSVDDHPIEFKQLSLHDPQAPIFLPPIHSEKADDFDDFRSASAAPIFRPFQEKSPQHNAVRETFELTFKPPPHSELTEEEIRLAAEQDFESRVSKLKRRLSFLPNYSQSLHFTFDYGSSTRAILKIDNNASAMAGSRAEVRWMEFARHATGDWLFFDEPEAGLHRTAEADLARVLSSPAWSVVKKQRKSGTISQRRNIVVATHSPEFLSLPEANIIHVDDGRARKLTSVDRDNLALLGLRPADLLSRIETFLVVEGEHERIVFETLFMYELHQSRTSIIAARGGKNMKDVFDSQVLFDFTDARVVALLDNIDANHVDELWSRARDLAAVGQVDEAGDLVRSGLPRRGSGENRFLANFLTRALEDGEHERVGAWGLSKEDIILYLPPAAFAIKRTWEEALSTYDPESDGSLKPWLTKKYGADFSLANVRAAAESLDDIPEDFITLIQALGVNR